MNDTNTTDTRQPVQGSGIVTGHDLKTRRERPGGDDTAVQFSKDDAVALSMLGHLLYYTTLRDTTTAWTRY